MLQRGLCERGANSSCRQRNQLELSEEKARVPSNRLPSRYRPSSRHRQLIADPTIGRMARDTPTAHGLDPSRFRCRNLVDYPVLALTGMLDEPRILEPLERGDGRRPRPPPEPDEVGEARARIGAHHREQGLVRLGGSLEI